MDEKNLNKLNTAFATSILALILAIIALFIGVAALDRTGVDFSDVVDEPVEEVEETAEDVDLALARARAQTRLLALKADLYADREIDDLEGEIADIRADLAEAYEDASVEARQEWEQIDDDLAAVEREARDETADAIDLVEDALAALEHEVRVDEDA